MFARYSRYLRRARRLGVVLVIMALAFGTSCASAAGIVLQAEDGELVRTIRASAYGGFTGTGYADYANEAGSYVEWVLDVGAATSGDTLALRYANGSTATRKLKLFVNGVQFGANLAFGPTGGWSSWRSKPVSGIALRPGLNTIRAESIGGKGGPNLDVATLTSTAEVSLTDWAQALVHSTIDVRYPDPAQLGPAPTSAWWRYQQGLYLLGQYRVYQRTGTARYLDYIKGWVDARTDPITGNLLPARTADPKLDFLDTVMPGRIVLPLDGAFGGPAGEARYRLTADRLWDTLGTHKRTPDGIFWHTNASRNTVLLDGAYMALPFATLYGQQFGRTLPGKPDLYHDVANQLIRHRYHLQDAPGTEIDPPTGTRLFYHAYDLEGNGTTHGVDWSEGTAKHSSVIWCRAMGWYAMAIVDVLDLMPSDAAHRADRDALIAIFRSLIQGLAAKQSSDGRWLTVVHYPSRAVAGNFLDSSCSAMLVYAISKAVGARYLDGSYRKMASRAYKGVLGALSLQPEMVGDGIQYLTSLSGIAAGQQVEAIPELYTTSAYDAAGAIVPRINPLTNDMHGLGAFLLMYEQVKRDPTTIAPF